MKILVRKNIGDYKNGYSYSFINSKEFPMLFRNLMKSVFVITNDAVLMFG